MSTFANKAMYSSTLVAFAVLQGCGEVGEVPVNDNQNDQVASSSNLNDLMVNLQGSEVVQKFESSVEAVIEAEVIEPLLEEVTPSLECKQTFIEKFFKLDTHQTITSGATGTTKVEGFDAGLFDAFSPISKRKDYLYKGKGINCVIGATVEDTTCEGTTIEDEAALTAITTCVQRTEMQHRKHLRITAAVLGLVVVAIIVAVVLAVQHAGDLPEEFCFVNEEKFKKQDNPDAECKKNSDSTQCSGTCEWNEPHCLLSGEKVNKIESLCKGKDSTSGKDFQWIPNGSCLAKGETTTIEELCQQSSQDGCVGSQFCNWEKTCASFESCSQGTKLISELKRCPNNKCDEKLCCEDDPSATTTPIDPKAGAPKAGVSVSVN